jgi:PAS domain S-box-containing protein
MTRPAAGLTAYDLDLILANTHDGLFVINRERRFVFFNEAMERLTGYTAREVLGLRCACGDVVECRDEQGRSLKGTLCPGLAVFNGSQPHAAQRMSLRRRSGEDLPVETVYTPIRDARGGVDCVIGVVRDASEQRRRERQMLEELADLSRQVVELKSRLREAYGFDNLISRSPSMAPVFQKVRAACAGRSSVLICGPSGTGKEVIARTIHSGGRQKDGPFVPLNCAALPRDLIESELFGHVQGSFTGASRDFPGLFRAAENGTIFLDEVAEMPVETQAKLLRALQDHKVRPVGSTVEVPVNARVIAATNADVENSVRTGRLREDLFYRLSVITVQVPPLRRRKEDIPLLAQHFLDGLNAGSGAGKLLAPATMEMLGRHDWPGNVRELENAIESAFAVSQSEVIRVEDLPARVRPAAPDPPAGDVAEAGEAGGPARLDDIVDRAERRAILAALERTGGNRSAAAEVLGIPRSRLYRRMASLGIPADGA